MWHLYPVVMQDRFHYPADFPDCLFSASVQSVAVYQRFFLVHMPDKDSIDAEPLVKFCPYNPHPIMRPRFQFQMILPQDRTGQFQILGQSRVPDSHLITQILHPQVIVFIQKTSEQIFHPVLTVVKTAGLLRRE